MTEILSAGAWVSADYNPDEFREALWKAFVRDSLPSIKLRNSKRESPFLAAGAAYGVQRGWLAVEAIESYDEQDAGDVRLTLTEEGRKEFGLDSA